MINNNRRDGQNTPSQIEILGDYIRKGSYHATLKSTQAYVNARQNAAQTYFRHPVKGKPGEYFAHSLYDIVEENRCVHLYDLIIAFCSKPAGTINLDVRNKVLANLLNNLGIEVPKVAGQTEPVELTQALFKKLNKDGFKEKNIQIQYIDGAIKSAAQIKFNDADIAIKAADRILNSDADTDAKTQAAADRAAALLERAAADDIITQEIRRSGPYSLSDLGMDDPWLEGRLPKKLRSTLVKTAALQTMITNSQTGTVEKSKAQQEFNKLLPDPTGLQAKEIQQTIYFWLNINEVLAETNLSADDRAICNAKLDELKAMTDTPAITAAISLFINNLYRLAYKQAVADLSAMFVEYNKYFVDESKYNLDVFKGIWEEHLLATFDSEAKKAAMLDFLYKYAYTGGFIGGLSGIYEERMLQCNRMRFNVVKSETVSATYTSIQNSIEVVEISRFNDIVPIEMLNKGIEINFGIRLFYTNDKDEVVSDGLPMVESQLINVLALDDLNQPYIEIKHALQRHCDNQVFENFWKLVLSKAGDKNRKVKYRNADNKLVDLFAVEVNDEEKEFAPVDLKEKLRTIWIKNATELSLIAIPQEIRDAFKMEADRIALYCNRYIDIMSHDAELANAILKDYPWIEEDYRTVKRHNSLEALFSGHDRFDKILAYYGKRCPQFAVDIHANWKKIALLGLPKFKFTMKLLYRLGRNDLVADVFRPVYPEIDNVREINEALITEIYEKLKKYEMNNQNANAGKLHTRRSFMNPDTISLIGRDKSRFPDSSTIHNMHDLTTVQWCELDKLEIIVNNVRLEDYIYSKKAAILAAFILNGDTDEEKGIRRNLLTVSCYILTDGDITTTLPTNAQIHALLPKLTDDKLTSLKSNINLAGFDPDLLNELIEKLEEARDYFRSPALSSQSNEILITFLKQKLFKHVNLTNKTITKENASDVAKENDVLVNSYIEYIFKIAHTKNLFLRPEKYIEHKLQRHGIKAKGDMAQYSIDPELRGRPVINFIMEDGNILVSETMHFAGFEMTKPGQPAVQVHADLDTYATYVISLDQHKKPQVHMFDGGITGHENTLTALLSTKDNITSHNLRCKEYNEFAEYYIAHGLAGDKFDKLYAAYSHKLHNPNSAISFSLFTNLITGETREQKLEKFLIAFGKFDSGYAVERYRTFKALLANASELLMEDYFIRAIEILTKSGRSDLALNIVRLAENTMTETDLGNQAKLKIVFSRLAQGVKARGVPSFFDHLPYKYSAPVAVVEAPRSQMNGRH